ncbi:helix-turn-helix domain-containing protein [Nocardia sp. CA-128927]|uniref:helix-turn-helix domain-containing protein n=1 Tax=Nocardia sp. CA-128927 TaxID=3239975 RepID=UPI003D958223
MKWNLRWVAAKQDIWRPTQLQAAFQEVGFEPSLSKVAALWSNKPVTLRLDDLDKICAALNCTVADLLEAEPEHHQVHQDDRSQAVGEQRAERPAGPTPGPARGRAPRSLPPN